MPTTSGKIPKPGSLSLVILAVLAVSYTLHALAAIFIPIIVALLFAAFLEPIIHKMVVIKVPRIIAILVCVAVSILFLGLLFLVVIASLSDFFRYIANLTPQATFILAELLESDLGQALLDYFDIEQQDAQRLFSLSSLLTRFVNELSSTILSFTNLGVNFFSSAFMTTLFTVFFLIEAPDFAAVVLHVMGSKSADTFASLGAEISVKIGRYLYVKTLVSVMTGLASLTGLRFATMWGLLGFLLNFIPVIGSTIVVIGTMVAGLLQFYSDPSTLLIILISMPCIQVIFGNILDPRMQGKSLDLSPSLVLISLSIWGVIWGIPGMFLSVPATVLIKIILHKFDSTRYLANLMGLRRQEMLLHDPKETPSGN
jgi:AI-2 transport protein TqsA